MVKSFKKLNTPDISLNRVQDNVEQVLKPLLVSPILNGVLLQDVVVPSGSSALVEHRLGREALGYIVVKRSGAGVVFDNVLASSVDVKKFISLRASVSVTVDLWVF